MEILVILGIIYFFYTASHGKTEQERKTAIDQAGKHSGKIISRILQDLLK